jgi:hypothetical protein
VQPDPTIPTPSRWFRERPGLPYVPGWTADAPLPVVGRRAVVFGLGQWREGVIVKVTRSYVFAQYHVASSDRLWVGRGSRTGNSTDLYLATDRL